MVGESKGGTRCEDIFLRMSQPPASGRQPDPGERGDPSGGNPADHGLEVFVPCAQLTSPPAFGGWGELGRCGPPAVVPVGLASWQSALAPSLHPQDTYAVDGDDRNCGTPICMAIDAARDPYDRLLGEVVEHVDRRMRREVGDDFLGGLARLLVVGGIVLGGAAAWSAFESWLGCRCGWPAAT